MAQINTRHDTRPMAVPRTRRRHNIKALTSLPAGKVVPIAVVPLLREDAMAGRVAFAFEMQQTVEVLANGIDVVVEAWLVPHLAMPEFRTMDDINLAYTGRKRDGEAAVTPYFVSQLAGDPNANEIHKRLGKHRKATQKANMQYVRAYNAAVNFARMEVSPNIPQRELLDKTLAQALWPNNKFKHIVPDFDQAVMQGEVALQLTEQNLVLKGPGGVNNLPVSGKPMVHSTDAPTVGQEVQLHPNYGLWYADPKRGTQAVGNLSGLRADLTGAVAKLAANGFKMSLANFALAQKAQVFANIRKRYNAHEDMIRDILMDGMTIPEQDWRQPSLIAKAQTRFGMAKRYSSDADALTESVVDGAAAVSFSVRTPAVPCGGVVVFVAYAAPEQLFERQMDPYLVAESADDLPSFLEDHLDPEAVDVVKNNYIDNDHDNPDDTYGYAPKNFMWNDAPTQIGGRFYRPEVDAGFDEDRNAIWAVETQNPRLTKDAYLVPADIHLKPFWTQTIDPFDCLAKGDIVIEGLTQFGPALIEALPESDYDAIMDRVDQTLIDREPVAP